MGSGEALAVEQYTCPGMLNLAHHLGICLVPIPMDEEGMKPESLLSIAKQHKLRGVYLMPTLQNPTTVTMSERRRQKIARLIRELDIFLINFLQKISNIIQRIYAGDCFQRCFNGQGIVKVPQLSPGRLFFT